METKYDLIAIDGLNLFFRNHAKIGHLETSYGWASGAMYGTIRSVLALLNEFRPTYFTFVVDGRGAKLERQKTSTDYKSNRPAERELMIGNQLSALREFFEYTGLNWLQMERKEADDVLSEIAYDSTLVPNFTPQNKVMIVSEDHDMYQCLRPQVDLYHAMKKLMVTEEMFKEWNGIDPWRYPEVQAITGCATDNVIGVKGVGEKTALKYLLKHGNLKNAVENEPKLAEYKNQIFRNFLLVKHNAVVGNHASVAFSQFKIPRGFASTDKLDKLLSEWELNSIARQLENSDLFS